MNVSPKLGILTLVLFTKHTTQQTIMKGDRF